VKKETLLPPLPLHPPLHPHYQVLPPTTSGLLAQSARFVSLHQASVVQASLKGEGEGEGKVLGGSFFPSAPLHLEKDPDPLTLARTFHKTPPIPRSNKYRLPHPHIPRPLEPDSPLIILLDILPFSFHFPCPPQPSTPKYPRPPHPQTQRRPQILNPSHPPPTSLACFLSLLPPPHPPPLMPLP